MLVLVVAVLLVFSLLYHNFCVDSSGESVDMEDSSYRTELPTLKMSSFGVLAEAVPRDGMEAVNPVEGYVEADVSWGPV